MFRTNARSRSWRMGRLFFDQQTLTPDELLDKLNAAKKEYPRMGVVVRGDGKVHFERVGRCHGDLPKSRHQRFEYGRSTTPVVNPVIVTQGIRGSMFSISQPLDRKRRTAGLTPRVHPLQIFLLIGTAVLAIALMLLTLTRWGHARPIWKCVILSLGAHVLLMTYAYGTHLILEVPQKSPSLPN